MPWDDQTDQFISAIDEINQAEKHTNLSLREVLLSPDKYLGETDILKDLETLQSIADGYFTETLSKLQDEQKELDQLLAMADMNYSKIDSVIATKASAGRVPYMQPYAVYTNPDQREEIMIDKYEDSLELLIGRLANGANYVANLSGSYKEHKLGSWLFSGSKAYVLTLNPPTSVVMDIERSKTAIKDMLASIAEGAKALQK